MDLTNSTTKTNTNDTAETGEYQNPPPPQSQLIFYTNGSLSHHHQPPPPATGILRYRECLRNHAATIGGHAVDGCREFIASLTASSADPTSIKCAACGCHRNFHRKEDYRRISVATHFTRRPRRFSSSPSTSPSLSPSPRRKVMELPSVVHPPGAHMDVVSMPLDDRNKYNGAVHVDDLAAKRRNGNGDEENSSKRKRSRTKFTQDQKEKMQVFAESLGWKMQKSDGRLVEEFCNEVGISKHVFKVWMHNNKSTFGKKDNNAGENDLIRNTQNVGSPVVHHPPQVSPEKNG